MSAIERNILQPIHPKTAPVALKPRVGFAPVHFGTYGDHGFCCDIDLAGLGGKD